MSDLETNVTIAFNYTAFTFTALSFGLVNIVGVYASLGDNLYGDEKADYTLLLVEVI